MFGFIVFGFKLLLAAIIGGALSYVPSDIVEDHKIVETSLICIFGAAVLGLSSQLSVNDYNFTMGLSILAVVIVVLSISKNLEFFNRIMWLFSAVAGMIMGAGYILQAALLSVFVYIILHNNEDLLGYLIRDPEKPGESSAENISN